MRMLVRQFMKPRMFYIPQPSLLFIFALLFKLKLGYGLYQRNNMIQRSADVTIVLQIEHFVLLFGPLLGYRLYHWNGMSHKTTTDYPSKHRTKLTLTRRFWLRFVIYLIVIQCLLLF